MLLSYVILGILLNFLETQFSYLQNGNKKNLPLRLVLRSNKMVYVKCLCVYVYVKCSAIETVAVGVEAEVIVKLLLLLMLCSEPVPRGARPWHWERQ